MGKPIIIVGCPRSGTMYMSLLFRTSGIEVTHESVFSIDAVLGAPHRIHFPDGVDGDSSFMAAPFLRRWSSRAVIVHLYRHPVAVIRSLLSTRWFTDNPESVHSRHHLYQRFVYKYVGVDCLKETELERALAFYAAWNRLIRPWAHHQVVVERVTIPGIVRILQDAGHRPDPRRISAAIGRLPRTVNTRPHVQEFTWKDAPCSWAKAWIETYVPYMNLDDA